MASSGFFLEDFQIKTPSKDKSHSCEVGPNMLLDLEAANERLDLRDNVVEPSFVATYPIPIGSPVILDRTAIRGLDPAHSAPMYRQLRSELLGSCEDIPLQKIEESLTANQPYPACNNIDSSLVYLSSFIAKDHRVYYGGPYDHNYGNTLTMVNIHGETVLLYPERKAPRLLKAVIPDLTVELGNLNRVNYIDHNMSSEQLFYQVDSEEDLVLLRQSKQCGFFRLRFVENLPSIQKLFSVDCSSGFLSARINKYSLDESVTLSSNFTISTHDMIRSYSKRAIQMFFSESHNYHGSIHYQDRNVLLVSQSDAVCLVDLREPASTSRRNTVQWNVTEPSGLTCSKISSSAQGQSLHYVCTNHHILSLDIRKGWCKRWSHGLPHSPSMISLVLNTTKNESLFVGCMNEGCVAYVDHTNSENCDEKFIKSSPFRLPNPKDTLFQARTMGYCLSPSIKSRFFMSLTGLASLQAQKKQNIVFTCSSAGDLFSQEVLLVDSRTDDNTRALNNHNIAILDRWEDQCLQQCSSWNSNVNVTRVLSCEDYVHLFEDDGTTLDSKASIKSNNNHLVDTAQPWRWSKQCLMKSCDLKTESMLSCWRLDDDDDDDDDYWIARDSSSLVHDNDSSEDDTVLSSDMLVRGWLMKCVEPVAMEDNDDDEDPDYWPRVSSEGPFSQ